MAGITLSIILDKPDKTYEGGETIAGQVRVVAAEDVRAAALMVVLYCKGYSEKKTRIAGPEIATMEREIEETKSLQRTLDARRIHLSLFVSRHPPVLGPTRVMSLMSPGISEPRRALPGERIRMSKLKRTSSSSPGKGHLKVRGKKGAKEVVHRQSARNLIGCFGFSLALFLVGSIVAWIYSPFAETAGDVEGVFFFGGIIPMLLGLLLIVGVTYQALINKRIKKVEVKLGSGQARPGEKIPCSITFEANIPFKIEKISAVLTGEEVVDFRSPSRRQGPIPQVCLA